MNDFELKDLAGNDVDAFVKAYRDALKQNYDSEVSRINQDKRNQEASIMGAANTAGMMFSNFPQRQKMQYQAQTYLPSLAKAHDTYRTGLQSLRSNAVKTYNNIQSLREAMADLDKLNNPAPAPAPVLPPAPEPEPAPAPETPAPQQNDNINGPKPKPAMPPKTSTGVPTTPGKAGSTHLHDKLKPSKPLGPNGKFDNYL